jgi:protein-disulfide isomerase
VIWQSNAANLRKIDNEAGRFDEAKVVSKLLAPQSFMKRYLPFVIVAAVALLTLTGGIMLYRSKRLPVTKATADVSVSEKEPNKPLHVRGEADAPVTLEEFGDFECPPCGTLSEPINKLEEDYRGRIRVIFRQFPLPVHAHAREAALASEAADMQGRFWQMHDVLYREQSVWSKAADVRALFNSYAGVIGLDIERFKRDMESDEAKTRVDRDARHAAALRVKTTPTIFINKQPVPPASLHSAGLRSAVDAALKATPATQ